MDDIRIDSQGFRVGRWSFPPFVLRRGQRIALRLPREAVENRESIGAVLTGREAIPCLALHGIAVWAQYAQPSKGWRH